MNSPITGNANVTEVDTLDVKTLSAKYKEEFDIDVEKYFRGLSSISIYECNATGYRFYYPFHIIGDASLYEQLQKRMGDHYYPRWKFENDVARLAIQKDDTILDIGCGDGVFLARIKAEMPDVKVTGIEFNQMAIDKCKAKGINVFNETIESFSAKGHTFDVVTMFQVLEHIQEIKPFLDAAIKVLRPGGKLVIGVPHSNPYLFVDRKYDALNCPPHHMGLWNSKAFNSLAVYFPIELSGLQVDPEIKVKNYVVKTDTAILKLQLKNKLIRSVVYRLLKLKNMLFSKGGYLVLPGHTIVAVFTKK